MLFMDEDTGRIGWGSIICAYFVPMIMIIAYRYMLKSTFENTDDTEAQARAL